MSKNANALILNCEKSLERLGLCISDSQTTSRDKIEEVLACLDGCPPEQAKIVEAIRLICDFLQPKE